MRITVQESPLELSFQVVATRRVKKRRHPQQSVLSNTQQLPIDSSRFPPPQPSSSDCDDVHEPPEKITKMENSNEESERRSSFREQSDISRSSHHMTPLSPEDHHGRPPTPPETPESQQHHQMHHDAKCEEGSSSEEQCDDEAHFGSASTHVDSNDGEDEDENLMGDQDSEAPLEVDTSHETEPELEIETETDDTHNKEEDLYSEEAEAAGDDFEPTSNEEHVPVDDSNASTDPDTGTNVSENDDSVDVKPPRRVRRNVVVQAGGQDGSCAFSDSDVDEPMDEVGALDLSDHARSVREARARGSLDLSRGQGTQTMLSITQSKTSKKKHKNNQASPASQSNWTHNQPSHAATFHDLLTLSQAAVIQLALVQARAQEEAKKSMEASKLGKLRETADTLSFVNGSGDTLTISAINSSDSGSKSATETQLAKTQGGHEGKSSGGGSSQKLSAEEHRAVTNTIIISRAGKHGTLKSKLNKSPTHKSSASNNPIRVPSTNSSSNASHLGGGATQLSNGLNSKGIAKSSLPVVTSSGLMLTAVSTPQTTPQSSTKVSLPASKQSIPSSNIKSTGGSQSFLKASSSVSISSTSTASSSGKLSSSISSSYIPKVTSSSSSASIKPSNDKDHKNISSTKSSASCSTKQTPSSTCQGSSINRSSASKPALIHPSSKQSQMPGAAHAGQTNAGTKSLQSSTSTKISHVRESGKSSQSNEQSKHATISISKSTVSNGNGFMQNKALCNGGSSSKSTNASNKSSTNGLCSLADPSKKNISSSSSSSSTSSTSTSSSSSTTASSSSSSSSSSSPSSSSSSSSSFTSSLISSSSSSSLSGSHSLPPMRSSTLSTSSSRTSLITPYRSLLSCVTTTNGISSPHVGLRTSTTNSAPVRATNSSVRQIPNPSLLHQQSESRLNGGRLTGVLGRLSNSSTGLSRIESLTRSLHEKAAGAAAAAVNTAAR
ncbi:hypothetical protein FHG87_004325 [Trinorchestia longiramus]|nr:hypothetical protein FHG87_004325 [Trinorchestia longiramus]